MSPYRLRRIVVVCLATLGLAGVASVSGLSVALFLAGVLGGGTLTAAYLSARVKARQAA